MPRTRRAAGGTIRERADGRWEARIRLGDGIRRSVYAKTAEDAAAELAKLQVDIAGGRTPKRVAKDSLQTFLERWIEEEITPDRKPQTTDDYERQVRKHIIPTLGAKRLSSISPDDVALLQKQLVRKKVGARTRLKVHVVLGAALKFAVRKGLIGINPVRPEDAPKYTHAPRKPLSAAQTGKLLAKARGHAFEGFFRLAVDTGMREGELFALRWEDVDFTHKAAYVQHSLQNVKGHRQELVPTKTDGSRRRVDLSAATVALLKRQKRSDKSGSEYVFHDQDGGPLSRHNFIRRVWKPLLEEAKLPAVRIHDLRHGMATLMLQAGVHPKVVQERLGHSRISTTLDTYSHVTPTQQRAATAKLEGLLRRSIAKVGVKAGGQHKKRSGK